MSNPAKVPGGIALVCDRADAEVLERFTSAGLFVGIDDYETPGFLDRPIVWLSPDELQQPDDQASAAYRRWVQVVHLISKRTYVQLSRITATRSLEDVGAWWERYHEQIDPKTQDHVRGAKEVAIVVFERDPTSDEMRGLTERFADTVLYLMMPQLRVTQDDQLVAFSMFVWHHAVARLLTRLTARIPPDVPGTYAWRGLEIKSPNVERIKLKIAGELDKYVRWLYALNPGVREASPISLKEPVELFKDNKLRSDTRFFRISEAVGSWFRFVAGKSRAMGESVAQLPKNDGAEAGRVSEPDTSSGERDLTRFSRLDLHGARTAPRLVADITNPNKVEAEARMAGDIWRGKQVDFAKELEDESRAQTTEWRSAQVGHPPSGGPGKPSEMFLTAMFKVSTAREAEAIQRMLGFWAAEFGRDRTDYEREREILGRLGAELQKARNHLVALWSRVVLGLLCAIIVGFTIATAVGAWSGIWWGRNSWGELFAREAMILSLLLASAALGVIMGVVWPYYLEVGAGKSAASYLRRRAVELKRRRVGTLNRRLALCKNARELARRLSALSIDKLTMALSKRAADLVRESLENRPLEPHDREFPLSAMDGCTNSLGEADARLSLAAYLSICTLQMSPAAGNRVVQTSSSEGPIQPTEEQEKLWKQSLQNWCEQLRLHDFKSYGWFPGSVVASAIEAAFRVLVEDLKRLAAGEQGQSSLSTEHEESLVSQIERFHPHSGEIRRNLGMMSLHFNVYGGGGPNLETIVTSSGDGYSNFLRKNLEGRPNIGTVIVGNGQCLDSEVLAEVFQELQVLYVSSRAHEKGFSWFDLAHDVRVPDVPEHMMSDTPESHAAR